jgi:hypothetical protein
MGLFKRSLAATVLSAGCFLSMPIVDGVAQAPPAGQTSPEGPSAAAPDLSDQKLDAAAAALKRVATLQKDYRQRFEQTEAPAEKERILAEANDELTKVINEQGISVEEYILIMNAARADAEVRGKILQRIRPADQ